MIIIGELGEITVEDPSWVLVVYNVNHLRLTPKELWEKAAEEEDAGDWTLLVYLYSAMLAEKLPKKWIRLLAWILKYKVKFGKHILDFELTPEDRRIMERLKNELSRIKRSIREPAIVEYDLWEKSIKGKFPFEKLIELEV